MITRLLLLFALLAPLPVAAQPRRVDAAGDPLPESAVVRLGTTRWRAGATIVLAAYLPEGRILTANQEHVVQIWDASGKAVRTIDVGGAAAEGPRLLTSAAVALSGNGKRFVAQGRDGKPRVWSVDDGSELRLIELPSTFNSSQFALSYDGSRLAVLANRRTLGVCDVSPGAKIRWLQPEGAATSLYSYRVEFSRDGKHVLQFGLEMSGNVLPFAKRWNVATGDGETLPLPSEVNSNTIARCVPSPDLSLLAGSNGSSIVITDLKTGKLAHRFDDAGMDFRTRLAFSADGTKLVAASAVDEMISVFDIPSKKLVAVIGTPPRENRGNLIAARLQAAISLSPDGKTLLAPQDSAILLVNLETGALRHEQDGHAGAIRGVSFDSSGKYVLTRGSDYTVRGWDAETGRPRGRLAVNPRQFSYVNSPDGRWLAVNDRTSPYRVVDAMSGANHFSMGGNHEYSYAAVVLFSPDSRLVAHVSRAIPSVTLYDTATGRQRAELRLPDVPPNEREIRINGPAGIVRFVSRRAWFSPDSRLIAVSGLNVVTVWDCESAQQLRQIEITEPEGPQHLAIAPDGYTLAYETAAGQVKVVEIATGQARFSLPGTTTKHGERIVGGPIYETAGYAVPIAYSPDGRLLALGCTDRSVRLWDMPRRIEVGSLTGHTGQVYCLAFTPDGRRLLSAGADSTALIWDLEPIRAKLTPVRAKIEDVNGPWQMLLDSKADIAANAIRTLAGDPEVAIPYLRRQLRPVQGPDPQLVAKLIADLNAPRYADRNAAGRELTRLGEFVASELRDAAQTGPTPEVRKHAQQILDGLAFRTPTGERLRTQRALEVLEQAATPDAVALLKELAGGAPVTIPTLQARAALRRLAAEVK